MNLSDIILRADINLLKEALSHIDNINYLDEYGYTPLTQAVITGSAEKTDLLLEKGADVNQKDLTGRTALHWAVSNDDENIIKRLLDKGANPNSYNIASEPVLAKAMMRGHDGIKKMLQQAGANNTFANDYIKVKLLGHRYELIGSVDIVDPTGVFTEVDYEGFYFESSVDLIRYSLSSFQTNFASRAIASWFNTISIIVNALEESRSLLKYDHYLANYNDQFQAVHRFMKQRHYILPVSQEGHAFSVVKSDNLLAIVDRSLDAPPKDTIPIYYINRGSQLTADLVHDIAFNKHPIKTIHDQLKSSLGLQPIAELPIADQAIGNCSWANIEATIPVMKYMLNVDSSGTQSNDLTLVADSLELFERWRQWDRQRSLDFIMQDFKSASPARKASIAALLAAILFQRCNADNEQHAALAMRLIPLIQTKGYEYILESYKQFYVIERPTKAGENLMQLLDRYQQERA